MQSAASQSQHVVNILASGDPVNAGDVEKVEADERNNNNTGLLAKGGPTAKVQVNVLALLQCLYSHLLGVMFRDRVQPLPVMHAILGYYTRCLL